MIPGVQRDYHSFRQIYVTHPPPRKRVNREKEREREREKRERSD